MNIRLTSRVLWLAAVPALALVLPAEAGQEAAKPVTLKIQVMVVTSTLELVRKHPRYDDLMKAGGRLINAPIVTTQAETPSKFGTGITIPYLIGPNKEPYQIRSKTFGMNVTVTPHVVADGSVHLDMDVDNSVLAPGSPSETVPLSPPALVKYGLFNSRPISEQSTTSFGTWQQGKTAYTVFAKLQRM